jgi:DNA modification methylase
MSTSPSASQNHQSFSEKSNAPSPEIGEEVAALFRDLRLEIEYASIDLLNEYEGNTRTHSPEQVEQVGASFEAFGIVAPFIADEMYKLIAGHARLAAAKAAGYTEVPVVRLTHLNDIQKKALRIGLNRLGEKGGWDRKRLADEFIAVLEFEAKLKLDISSTGWSFPEVDQILQEAKGDGPVEDLVPEPSRRAAPVSQRGDIIECGEHRLINGDARRPETYAALLGDARAAMGIHDPPYNVSVTKHISRTGRHPEFLQGVGEFSSEAFEQFLAEPQRAAIAHSRPGAAQLWFMDWRHMREMLNAGLSVGLVLRNLCVWDKCVGANGSLFRSQHELVFVFADPRGSLINNVQLGRFGRNRTNVWRWPGGPSLQKERLLHPTPKPVGMLAEAIRDFSHRGDIVLDSFSGSGSTIIAAAKTGRRCYAIELDPHYVDVAVRRWEDWSGETARHAQTGLTFPELRELRRAQPTSPAPVTQTEPSDTTPPMRVRHRARPVAR